MLISADYLILGARPDSVVLGHALREADQGYLILETKARSAFPAERLEGSHIVFNCRMSRITVTDHPRRFIVHDADGRSYEAPNLLLAADADVPLDLFPAGCRPLLDPDSGRPLCGENGSSLNLDGLTFLSFPADGDAQLEAALLVLELVGNTPDPMPKSGAFADTLMGSPAMPWSALPHPDAWTRVPHGPQQLPAGVA